MLSKIRKKGWQAGRSVSLKQQRGRPAGSEDQRAAAALCVDELTITRWA